MLFPAPDFSYGVIISNYELVIMNYCDRLRHQNFINRNTQAKRDEIRKPQASAE